MAPEVFKGTGYGYKVDIFSLGCVFFSMLTGRYIFGGASSQEVYFKNSICNVTKVHTVLEHISDQGKDLLYNMLLLDPSKRPTAKEALNHVWFKCD